MDAQTVIAKRIALELRDGMLVNLGIGIPDAGRQLRSAGHHVFFQSENGLIGTGPVPEEGMEQPLLTDAGGRPVSALPGACHLRQRDVVRPDSRRPRRHDGARRAAGRQAGHLANWMIPGKMVPGMGGAMDLVSGAKRVVIAMQHTRQGQVEDRASAARCR